jgi:hypothetical protein
VRIRSARWPGVSLSGARVACAAPAGPRGFPHSPQKRCPAGLAEPHEAQTAARRAPHSPQNFMPAGLSCPHAGHLMPVLR